MFFVITRNPRSIKPGLTVLQRDFALRRTLPEKAILPVRRGEISTVGYPFFQYGLAMSSNTDRAAVEPSPTAVTIWRTPPVTSPAA